VIQFPIRSGYSERAMYRLLKRLYREMGVNSLVDAIVRAGEWGCRLIADARQGVLRRADLHSGDRCFSRPSRMRLRPNSYSWP
jgi:hypothetical protein